MYYYYTFFGEANNFLFVFSQGLSILADSGTEQLEFISLSQRTGDPKYQQKVIFYHLFFILCFYTISIHSAIDGE